MGSLRIFLLWLMWRLLRWPSVVLVDHDGEIHARLIRGTKSHPVAARFGCGVKTVRLMSDGTTLGACYVKTWEYLFPATLVTSQQSKPTE